MRWLCFAMLILTMGLSACAKDRNAVLTKIRKTGNGPDEFTVVPGKELQMPPSTTDLPPPTVNTGYPNRADQNPEANLITALGGNPALLSGTTIPGRDGALVNYAARDGMAPSIRQTLAHEDAELRRRYGKVNIFGLGYTDDYSDAYRRQWLNADAERDRLRSYGVKTPTAPPG